MATRWLTEEEQQVWRLFLDATQLFFEEVDRSLQRSHDLSHADYEIFVRLSEAPGRQLRMSELAAQVRFSRSRLSHAVARLEREGWLRRTQCAEDKRGTLAELTDSGFAVLEAAAPAHVESVRAALIDRLTPGQLRQLGEISAAIRDGLLPECPAAE